MRHVIRAIPLLIIGFSLAPTAFAAPGSGCASALCELVASGTDPGLHLADFSGYAERLRSFYEPSGYALAWTRGGLPTPEAAAMTELFRDAGSRGLNPEDYDASHWAGRLAALSAGTVAEFDLAVTVCGMRYISDLHFGRANPGLYHNGKDPKDEFSDTAAFLWGLTGAPDVKAAMETLEPPYPGYRRTRQALLDYLALSREGALPLLPATAKPVEPFGAYPAAAQLAAILRRLGDLPSDAAVPRDAAVYNGLLVNAVKRFQLRHGLDTDGRLGKATVAQLNVPLSRRILQLELSLERWRWVPHTFPRPPIVVNIPEFRLRALNSSYQSDLEMKVVVGKAYGHETPVFSADMRYVVFRPYWDVPYSITRAELVPKLLKDPGYLARNRYEVVDPGGAVVGSDVSAATLARLRDGTLRVRQIPGPENALGLVKFLFPNENNVYLHSTPATELFLKTRRDFSHGCIRVEEPGELAAWVLRGETPEWTPERIHDAMNGDETIQVTLRNPIPVLIVYATAVVLESGEVRFFDDIYGEDARLERILSSRT